MTGRMPDDPSGVIPSKTLTYHETLPVKRRGSRVYELVAATYSPGPARGGRRGVPKIPASSLPIPGRRVIAEVLWEVMIID
jgi:hypothetical protein